MLYGRGRELGEIDRLLADARGGDGCALLISGEAGIGKTALLEAARERAEGMRVLEASGVESEAHLPFAALGEIADPLLDGLADLPEPQGAALGAALALASPSRPPADRLATFAGFLGLLRSATAARPLLVLVDDAHWLDSASAEGLGYAARRLAGSAVAVLAAARTGEERQALDARITRELRLSGLDREEALALLRSSARDLARTTVDAVLEAAAGNPLALLELPALLTEEQRRGLAPLDPTPAPDGVLWDAFERRVSRLPAEARAALLVAAASVDRALSPIVRACRQLEIADEALEQAEAQGLLKLAKDQVAFSHPLLKGAVYQGASPSERRRVHRALSAHTDEDARAWHLAAAALGPDAEVAEALEGAAYRAAARGAHSAAADALERAAQASEDGEARSRRLFGAGLAAGLGGAYDRAAALLEPVAEIADPGMRATVRDLLAMVTLSGGIRSALANHEMLTGEAERIRSIDRGLAAKLHADAGVTAVVAGDCRLALASAERAAALLPADAPATTRCQVLSMLGMGLALQGRLAEATEALDDAGRLLPHVDRLTPDAQSICFALHARLCTGQEGILREEALSLASAAREADTVGLLAYYQLVAADSAYRLGDWEAAGLEAADAVAIADDYGQRGALSIALVVRGRLHAALGEEEAARLAVQRGMALAEGPGLGATLIWGRAALGFLELGLGRAAEAIVELEQAERLAEAAGLEDPTIVPWAPDLVEAYARAGRGEDAEGLTSRHGARARRSGVPLALALGARCEGLVSEGTFDERFERALELHREAGSPFEHARTLLAYGSRLHRARRRAEARERLREALGTFERLKARPWADRATAELRAAGAIRRPPPRGPRELSPRELEVARAVGLGAPNREVAADLFLSEKTVEFHLRQIFRKLGVRSRTELAALMAREHPDGSTAEHGSD